MKKDVLKNLTKFTGRAATILKKRLWHRCFPKNFASFYENKFQKLTSCSIDFLLFFFVEIEIKKANESK